MKIRKELIRREIAGDVILVPVGGTVLENNGLFALNELGAFLWDRLESAEDEESLVQAVLSEYEVDEDTARTDTAEILDYADEAFSWAVAAGVIKGTTETTLDPMATTTRAQICLMVYRLLSAQD